MSQDDVERRIVGIVYGSCPMGCGQTLQVDGLGSVSCYAPTCTRPDAVARILANPETEHIVTIHPDHTWTVRHPLRERLQEELERCALHRDMVVLGLADTKDPGQYRVVKNVMRPPGRRAYSWEPVGHAQLSKSEDVITEQMRQETGCNTHGAHPHVRGGSPRHCLHCATCNPPNGFEFGRTAEQHWMDASATHLPNVERVDSERSRINPTDIDPRRPLTERHTNISGPYGGRLAGQDFDPHPDRITPDYQTRLNPPVWD